MRAKTGSIDVTRDGRFRVRLPMPSGERKTLGTFAAEGEAETARAAAMAVLEAEGPDDGETVRTWGVKWLNARDVGRAVVDPESDWSRWRNHIESDPISRIALKSLRRRHVKAWLARVRAKVARQTALNCMNVLRGLLAAAVDEEIIKLNPAVGFRLPKEKRTEEPWTFATLAEQRRIVLVADEPERWILAFAIGSGLRAGELVSLRQADVHVDGDDPHVVVRYGGAPDLPTKGGKIRRVPLFGIALLAAREWIAALPAFLKGRRASKRAVRNPLRLMFPRLRGGYRDHLHVLPWVRWQAILEAAGIERDFRWHDLRHTAGSSLVSGFWGRAWTLLEVRDFLGHESVTTTERYAHLADTALKRAAAETRAARGQLTPLQLAPAPESPAMIASSQGLPKPRVASSSLAGDAIGIAGLLAEFGERSRPIEATSLALLHAVTAGDATSADRLRIELGVLFGAALVTGLTRAIALAERVLLAALARSTERSA